MTIVPDTKDWTWVLERRCPECGVDAATIGLATVGDLVRETAASWTDVLGRPDAGERPDGSTWSPLEYACHVRDVLRLYDERLRLMLEEDGPRYPNWDQDAAAEAGRYGEQAPAAVAGDLDAAARALAARFDGVTGDGWERTGFRSDGASFTVASFSRYLLHDLLHHLHDVGAPLPGGRAG